MSVKRGLLTALVLFLVAGWWLSRPLGLSLSDLPAHRADPANGERLFHAGGCASCHATERPDEPGPVQLDGGVELESPYGVFRAPNISSDPDDGIGRWNDLDFANAMLRGVSPRGDHYYPAFPYASYTRMSVTDVLDLKAYLDTLPPVRGRVKDHDLRFPYTMRRLLGFWKRLYLDPTPVRPDRPGDEAWARGRYLVEGPGHCGECHTPRDALGGLRLDAWLSGAPSLEGEGKVPDIRPGALEEWSASDLVYYLETGMDPDYDVVGGPMVEVQENLAQLPDADREAIAVYLKSSD